MVKDDNQELDLEPGDFLYQTDQELFLVVMEERDESYLFSVHGWRDIGNERLEEYLNSEKGKLYRETELQDTIQESDESVMESFEELKELFNIYNDDFKTDGPSEDFKMEDK